MINLKYDNFVHTGHGTMNSSKSKVGNSLKEERNKLKEERQNLVIWKSPLKVPYYCIREIGHLAAEYASYIPQLLNYKRYICLLLVICGALSLTSVNWTAIVFWWVELLYFYVFI